MKRIQLLLILLMAVSIHGKAQYFRLYGLEIYNPSYHNPAYVGAENLIRADVIATSNFYSTVLNSRIMTTLPGGKHSLGIGFDKSGYYSSFSFNGPREKTMDYYMIDLAYNHTFQLREALAVHAGAAIHPAKLDFLQVVQGIDSSLLYQRSLSASIGVAVDYKNFTAGVSTHIPFYSNKFYLDETNNIEKKSNTSTVREFHMFGKYESKSPRRVTLDPLFGVYLRYGENGDYSEWLGYAGGHIQIVDLVGLGITAGSLVSVSTTLNIKDRLELMLGIYAGEKLWSDGLSSLDYGLNFGDRQYIIQLRVNL